MACCVESYTAFLAHVQEAPRLDVLSDHRAGVKAVTIKSGVSRLPLTVSTPPSDVVTDIALEAANCTISRKPSKVRCTAFRWNCEYRDVRVKSQRAYEQAMC